MSKEYIIQCHHYLHLVYYRSCVLLLFISDVDCCDSSGIPTVTSVSDNNTTFEYMEESSINNSDKEISLHDREELSVAYTDEIEVKDSPTNNSDIIVEEVPLHEDEEFCGTFLNPKNNQVPSPGEIMEPVDEDTISVIIKTITGSWKRHLLIVESCTVAELKRKISTMYDADPHCQLLCFDGQLLEDDCCILEYGIQSNSIIHLSLSIQGAGDDAGKIPTVVPPPGLNGYIAPTNIFQ